jgi:hypothetical protein
MARRLGRRQSRSGRSGEEEQVPSSLPPKTEPHSSNPYSSHYTDWTTRLLLRFSCWFWLHFMFIYLVLFIFTCRLISLLACRIISSYHVSSSAREPLHVTWQVNNSTWRPPQPHTWGETTQSFAVSVPPKPRNHGSTSLGLRVNVTFYLLRRMRASPSSWYLRPHSLRIS